MTDKLDAVAAAEPSSPPAGGRAKRDRRAPEVFRPEVKEKEEFIIKQVGIWLECCLNGFKLPHLSTLTSALT